jgi:alpha-ribazole phosphatase
MTSHADVASRAAPAPGRLWIARHAPVTDRTICYGRTDVAVQIAPDHAAASLLASYSGGPPRRVWSSPASRCRLVAEHLAAALCVPLTIDAALGELDLGAWEGRPWTTIQIEERAAYEAWMNDWQQLAPHGGERPADIEARVRGWLLGIGSEGVHWVIGHSGVVRALSVIVEDYSWPDAMRREVRHLEWNEFLLQPSRGARSSDSESGTW